MSHSIPDAALDKHIAALGMTGSGKTSVIKAAIVEPDLEEDRRVIIVTPKDDWWGLRLSKTGKSKAYEIPIFGGYHEDYPLRVADAELLAETYGTMKGSAIFCTAKLSTQDRARWFSAFAETLLRKNKGWVRVVVDEAHVFMPKQGGKGGGAIPAALHAGNELVSQGRSQGLRIVLASQRSAKLHNDSLTQCSCLIAMMLMAPHDRDAVKDWIEDQADPQQGKEIISSLAQLKPGEAWVWAPRAGMLERIQFPRPKTYDSSAAPDEDSEDAPKLSPVSLNALQGKLAKVEAERKANDPAALKAEIARLQREAKQPVSVDPNAVEEAEKRGYVKGAEAHKNAMTGVVAGIENAWRDVQRSNAAFVASIEKAIETLQVQMEYKAPPKAAPRSASSVPRQISSRVKPIAPTEINGFTGPQVRILRGLAMWKALGHHTPSREMVAAVAGYKPSTGNFNNLLGGLGAMGAVGKPMPGCLSLQAPGFDMTIDEGRDMLIANLSDPKKRIVAALIDQGARSREDVAADAGYQPSTGNYNNLVGSLTTIDVLRKPAPGQLVLSPWAQELLNGRQ